MNSISIKRLSKPEAVWAFIEPLDIIFAYDPALPEDNKLIVYGNAYLEIIASGVIGNQECAVGQVTIDFGTDDLALLLQAVETVKGFHELDLPRDDSNPPWN